MASSPSSLLTFSLFCILALTYAKTKTLTIFTDDTPMIPIGIFKITPRGSVSISLSSVSFTSALAQPNPTLFGFFLLSDNNLLHGISHQSQNPNPNPCILFSPYIRLLFTFKDLDFGSFNNTFSISIPDECSLFFANCLPGSTVSMVARTELLNLNSGQNNWVVICCCAILFLLVWSFSILKVTWKTIFRQFYMVVIGYLYFARIMVYAMKTVTHYKHRWVIVVAEEVMNFTIYMFRPVKKKHDLVLDEEEEVALQTLEEDMSEI